MNLIENRFKTRFQKEIARHYWDSMEAVFALLWNDKQSDSSGKNGRQILVNAFRETAHQSLNEYFKKKENGFGRSWDAGKTLFRMADRHWKATMWDYNGSQTFEEWFQKAEREKEVFEKSIFHFWIEVARKTSDILNDETQRVDIREKVENQKIENIMRNIVWLKIIQIIRSDQIDSDLQATCDKLRTLFGWRDGGSEQGNGETFGTLQPAFWDLMNTWTPRNKMLLECYSLIPPEVLNDPEARVLDLGAGTGIAGCILRRSGAACRLLAVEPEKRWCNHLKTLTVQEIPVYRDKDNVISKGVFQGYLSDLPASMEKSFDHVLSVMVHHHDGYFFKTLQYIHKLLKNDKNLHSNPGVTYADKIFLSTHDTETIEQTLSKSHMTEAEWKRIADLCENRSESDMIPYAFDEKTKIECQQKLENINQTPIIMKAEMEHDLPHVRPHPNGYREWRRTVIEACHLLRLSNFRIMSLQWMDPKVAIFSITPKY